MKKRENSQRTLYTGQESRHVRGPVIAVAIAVIVATSALGQSTSDPAATSQAGIGCCPGAGPQPQPVPPPANATFFIKSASSGMMLDVPKSQPGQPIEQLPLNWSTNQQWGFHNSTGRGLEIDSLSSGLVLDDPGFSTQPGVKLQQWTSNLGTNQQWGLFWNANGSGGFEIQSVSSRLVLDVPPSAQPAGTIIQLGTRYLHNNEQWQSSRVVYPDSSMSITSSSTELHQIRISGWGATPGTRLRVLYMGVPLDDDFQLVAGPSTNVYTNGGFDLTYSVSPIPYCYSNGPCTAAHPFVTVLVEDEDGYVVGIGHVPADLWTSPLPPPPPVPRSVRVCGTIQVHSNGANVGFQPIKFDTKLSLWPITETTNSVYWSDKTFGGCQTFGNQWDTVSGDLTVNLTLSPGNSVSVQLVDELIGFNRAPLCLSAASPQDIQTPGQVNLLLPPGQGRSFDANLANSDNSVWAAFHFTLFNDCAGCSAPVTCPGAN